MFSLEKKGLIDKYAPAVEVKGAHWEISSY